jgi:hypothetical protein
MQFKRILENINKFSSDKKVYLTIGLSYVILFMSYSINAYFYRVIDIDIFKILLYFYFFISFVIFSASYIVDGLDKFYFFYFFIFFICKWLHEHFWLQVTLPLTEFSFSIFWLLVMVVQNYKKVIEKKENF